MGKKGVSPVIATVLLIGLVVTLALVISLWFRGFTQETITKFGGENVQLVCNNVKFEASYSSDGQIAISNTGNVPVFSFNVQIEKGAGEYSSKSIGDLVKWPNTGLRQGGVISGNIAGKIPSNTKDIILIPILRGSTSSGQEKSSVCKGSGYKIQIAA